MGHGRGVARVRQGLLQRVPEGEAPHQIRNLRTEGSVLILGDDHRILQVHPSPFQVDTDLL